MLTSMDALLPQYIVFVGGLRQNKLNAIRPFMALDSLLSHVELSVKSSDCNSTVLGCSIPGHVFSIFPQVLQDADSHTPLGLVF
jgi:hypothetical protein